MFFHHGWRQKVPPPPIHDWCANHTCNFVAEGKIWNNFVADALLDGCPVKTCWAKVQVIETGWEQPSYPSTRTQAVYQDRDGDNKQPLFMPYGTHPLHRTTLFWPRAVSTHTHIQNVDFGITFVNHICSPISFLCQTTSGISFSAGITLTYNLNCKSKVEPLDRDAGATSGSEVFA